MNLNLIIDNLALLTVTAMNLGVVVSVANDSKNSFSIHLITLTLSGGLAIVFKDIVSLLYSLPFHLIKESSIDLTTSFSDENIGQTKQALCSILIFNFLLYFYFKFSQYWQRRTQRLIEKGRKSRVEGTNQQDI